jgi:hypothetical protein
VAPRRPANVSSAKPPARPRTTTAVLFSERKAHSMGAV